MSTHTFRNWTYSLFQVIHVELYFLWRAFVHWLVSFSLGISHGSGGHTASEAFVDWTQLGTIKGRRTLYLCTLSLAICVCVYIYTYIHIYIHTYIHMCVCIYIYVCICCLCIYVYMCTYACVYMRIRTCAGPHVKAEAEAGSFPCLLKQGLEIECTACCSG